MPTLNIYSIYCHTTEDNNPEDETYVLINGQRVWGPHDFRNQSSADPGIRHEFGGRVSIQLKEEDSWDADDNLGSFDVHEHELNEGDKRINLTSGGASYDVYYRVV